MLRDTISVAHFQTPQPAAGDSSPTIKTWFAFVWTARRTDWLRADGKWLKLQEALLMSGSQVWISDGLWWKLFYHLNSPVNTEAYFFSHLYMIYSVGILNISLYMELLFSISSRHHIITVLTSVINDNAPLEKYCRSFAFRMHLMGYRKCI